MGKIIFTPEYFKKCYVQQNQNEKFLRFMIKTLKKLFFYPKNIIELGAGDDHIIRTFKKIYSPDIIYVVDINEEILKKKTSTFNNLKGIIKDISKLEISDFATKFDLAWSSNTFHWLPFRRNGEFPWLNGIKNVYNLLVEGGLFFIHQGLKWTYFPLYDLANELYFKKYGFRLNIDNYLFYPSKKEIICFLKETGFKLVDENCFYEFELQDTSYTKEHLYESFSVAGLNVFLTHIESQSEKDNFKNAFFLYVIFMNLLFFLIEDFLH